GLKLFNVRFGALADIGARQINVRFTPGSGHWKSIAECPLCAKSRRWRSYSITSSASASKSMIPPQSALHSRLKQLDYAHVNFNGHAVHGRFTFSGNAIDQTGGCRSLNQVFLQ